MSTLVEIPLAEFKKLLYEIKSQQPDIQIRYRLLGNPWNPNYVNISVIKDLKTFENTKEVMFFDRMEKSQILIKDIANIIQFEIDSPFGEYQAHVHYSVVL